MIKKNTLKKFLAKHFHRTLLAICMITFWTPSVLGQRYMENLDRGLIAMRTGTNSVQISWRIPANEYSQNATYNLYRGTTLIASNLEVSNFVDATGTDSTYKVAAVVGGKEQALSPAKGIRGNQFFTIPVRAIDGSYTNHTINDASVGDLDGDGEYEIVVKRIANDETPGSTNYHHLEAYKMDGTFMWDINLGPNFMHDQEVNFLVYDFDNDGKAEVVCRTSDGTIDGVGKNFGDRDGDGIVNYRSTAALNTFYFRIHGPDFISVFNGQTGAEITWNKYIDREPIAQWGVPGNNISQLAHRATKCMWAVAYLDGVNPSFIISRGIYERIKLEAWHFGNGTLTKEWAWDSAFEPGKYSKSGNHNLAAGDLDGDGRDEITYGAMAVDEYGKGLYTTGFEHGDAGHLADINPDIPGLEFFGCQEYANGVTIPGLAIRSAANGTVQWANNSSGDIGRCMAADIDPNHYGMEVWGADGSGLRSCTGELISTTIPTATGGGVSYNFGIWWDGDLQREILDKTVIGKWNGTGTVRVATLYSYGVSDNNGTKSNPCLMADILGDWREEVIFRLSDNTGMVVFETPFSTQQRMYTLMHDPNYRSAVAWQNNTYNQPPNLGFYFGGGMKTPPIPNIKLVNGGCMATTIVPFIGINGGTLVQQDEVSIDAGTTITLSPKPETGGSWSWTGAGTSGTSREQTLTPTQSGVATVTYTNDGGCVSTFNFNIIIKKNTLHYKFDEISGTTAADNSGNGNNGTVSGSAVFAAGHASNAIALDGVNDFVSAPAGVVDDLNNVTVSAWVYWNGGGAWQRIFDFGNNTAQNMFLTTANGNGVLQFTIINNGNTQNVYGPQLAVNTWTHVAVTLSKNGMKMYVNGNNVAQYEGATVSPSDFKPVNNYIGKSQWPDPLLKGLIDDFRVYNYELTALEIANMAGIVNTPPSVSLSSPMNGAGYFADAVVNITAAVVDDSDFGTSVEFFADGNSIGIDRSSPFSIDYKFTTVGQYNLTAVVTDNVGQTATSEVVIVSVNAANKISGPSSVGTIIGHSGSWGNNANTVAAKAFDDNTGTYVDSPTAFGWMGYDFGSDALANMAFIRYWPRTGLEARMNGSELRGSNDSDYLNNYTVLYTISSTPSPSTYTTGSSIVAEPYRYIYWVTPAGYGNVAEMEFYGSIISLNCPAPTLSSVSQPDCGTATGSFTITNYDPNYTYAATPSAGVVIEGDKVTAPDGTYTLSASLGLCTSAASSTVVVANTCPDLDNDGVLNAVDLCPNTPSGETADATGCSPSQLDDDGDGIANNIDECPDTPAGEAVNAKGCSLSQIDTDDDGVADSVDQCPNTPAGELADANGCSPSQRDTDKDGVMDNVDQCPDTGNGDPVDAFGCFALPQNNFAITLIGESCPGKKNGQLTIKAAAAYNYSATINGVARQFTNNNFTVSDLAPGTYTFCITIDGKPFSQCFTAVIPASTAISGKTVANSDRLEVQIESGTAPYNVSLNGELQFETTETNFEVSVNAGDLLEIRTAKDCEGLLSKQISLYDVATALPNPSTGKFDIYLPTKDDSVGIAIYNGVGQLVSKAFYPIENGKVRLNIEHQPSGIYLVKLNSNETQVIKIIKK